VAGPAETPRPFELGFRGTALRRRLVGAVLRGEKTATSSLREHYRPFADEALPQVHERGVLLGEDDEPAGVVETTEVRVLPAGQVDLAFARAEGEGFESVAAWRAAHERFWSAQGHTVTDDTLVVCERFQLVASG
jgi:uncharacterized protein YhfF